MIDIVIVLEYPQPRENWGIAIMDMSTHDGSALRSLTGENVEGIHDNGREKNLLEYASKATEGIANALHLAHPVLLHSQMLQRDIYCTRRKSRIC